MYMCMYMCSNTHTHTQCITMLESLMMYMTCAVQVGIQRGVRARLLDSSTLVREAAVELIAKCIFNRPDLINEYYSMLRNRILDTGISVRKRVIKIFRDICVKQPEFEKVPEMCVSMIRRVNDRDGVKVGGQLLPSSPSMICDPIMLPCL